MKIETDILGMLLFDNKAISEVMELITPECFANEINRNIYEAIIKLHGEGRAVTSDLVYLECKEEPAYISQLTFNITSSGNVKYEAAKLFERHIARLQLKALDKKKARLQGNEDIYQVLLDYRNEIDNALLEFDRVSKPEKHLFERIEGVVKDIEERREGKQGEALRLKTLPSMNYLIGGIMPTDLIGIYGKEKSTKSSLAFEILLDIGADQRKPVMIFSYEMGRDELDWKALSMRTGISFNKLRNPQGESKNTNLTDDELHKLKMMSVNKFKHTKIFISDKILNEIQIYARVESMIRQHNIKLVVIDYLMLISSSKNMEPRREDLNYLSRFFKQMAQKLKVPIILISQANESGERAAEMKGLERDSNYFFYVERGEAGKKIEIREPKTNIKNYYTMQDDDYIVTLRGIRHAKGNRSFICRFADNRYVEGSINNFDELPV